MHLAWDHDDRPAWQVYLSFSADTADPPQSHDTPVPGNGHETKFLERTILGSGKARCVRVVIDDEEVVVSLRITAVRRGDAISDAYHLVRVAAPGRLLSAAGRGTARRRVPWPPPVGGA